MVHQHFRLVSRFTVAENVLLALGKRAAGAQRAGSRRLDRGEGPRDRSPGVRPDAIVADLSIADRQRTEILKVLLLGARIVILDEPTAVLTEGESEALLTFTRRLADQGHAVVLITHKLREVAARSDRVTVMRQGRTIVAGVPTASMNIDEIARQVVGSEVARVDRPVSVPGPERLRIEALSVAHADGTRPVDGLSLVLRAGEVLGVAGVGGNGQQELVDCLAGMVPLQSGRIAIDGRDIASLPIAARRGLGLRVVPSDRFATGMVRNSRSPRTSR